jgi:hypothetical protein
MNCKNEASCNGEVYFSVSTTISASRDTYDSAYPCAKCGRLHRRDGSLVNNSFGYRSFLKEGNIDYLPRLDIV